MKTEETLSHGIIRRILFIALVLLLLLGLGAFASSKTLNSVVVRFSDDTEITVITSKSNVNDILKENNIYISEDEIVTPSYEEKIGVDRVITISKQSEVKQASVPTQVEENEKPEVIEVTNENGEVIKKEVSAEESFGTIVEKIVKEQIEIPFETITKEATSKEDGEKTNRVVQEGKNGIKEITYKVKYQNDIEIDRTLISEVVIQEPVNKVIQVVVKTVSSRYSAPATSGSVADYQSYARQRCYAYGWSENDYLALVTLWNRESGWNPSAKNRSSGAYGIPQALPGSKMASSGSDWATNYQTQINWGLNYIKGRYGNPSSALAHSNSRGWY